MTRRRGCRALGLEVTWTFEFVGHGTLLHPRRDTVALDVGNRCEHGLLDQHQDEGLGPSTSRLVVTRPELVYDHLVGPWLDRADSGVDVRGVGWAPVITTHYSPDFDGVVSALLVQRLVEDGELPPWADALSHFAGAIDQGRLRFDKAWLETGRLPISCAFYARLGDDDTSRMQRGLSLLRAELAHLAQAVGDGGRWTASLFTGAHMGGWCSTDEGADIARDLRADYERYRADLATPGRVRADVTARLPLAPVGGAPWHPRLAARRDAKAMVVSEVPDSRMFKDWARADGFELLVIPRQLPRGVEGRTWLVVSIDPLAEDAQSEGRVTLRGLGAALESAERATRLAGGGDTRTGSPRWPGASNDDPWYDGRGHAYGIVDVPRDKSVLRHDQVVDLALDCSQWRLATETPSWSLQVVCPAAPRSGERVEPQAREAVGAGTATGLTRSLLHTVDRHLERIAERVDLPRELAHYGDAVEVRAYDVAWTWSPDVVATRFQVTYTGADLLAFLTDAGAWIAGLRDARWVLDAPLDVLPGEPTERVELAQLIYSRLTGTNLDLHPSMRVDHETYVAGGNVVRVPECDAAEDGWWCGVATAHLVHCYYILLAANLLEANRGEDEAERARVIRSALADLDLGAVSVHPRQQATYERLRAQSDASELTDKLRHQSDALRAEINNREEKSISFFVFVIGLMGLVEAVDVASELFKIGEGWARLILCVLFLALASLGLKVYRVNVIGEVRDRIRARLGGE